MDLKILSLICILFLQKVNGQTNEVNKYINNDSIKFDLIMTMPDFENGIYYSDYVLSVHGLDSTDKVLLKSFSKSQWMKLLRNSKSDWAANIILYSLYNKSAGIFRAAVKTRDNWLESSRSKDLAYWDSFLK